MGPRTHVANQLCCVAAGFDGPAPGHRESRMLTGAGDEVFDERRTRVFDFLKDRSSVLAGMYRTALDVLAAAWPTDVENARVSVICHCMRELMNGLPSVLSEATIPRPRPSSGALLRQLPQLLSEHPGVDLEMDQDLIPIPRTLAQALSALTSTVTKEQGRNRENTAALLTGSSSAKHPVIDQWTKTYQFFVGWTHLDRDHRISNALPTNAVLAEHFRVVEDVIEVRAGLFFENLHALEDLLKEINETTDNEI